MRLPCPNLALSVLYFAFLNYHTRTMGCRFSAICRSKFGMDNQAGLEYVDEALFVPLIQPFPALATVLGREVAEWDGLPVAPAEGYEGGVALAHYGLAKGVKAVDWDV